MCCVVLQGWCFYFTKRQTNEMCAIFILYFVLFLFVTCFESQRYCGGGVGGGVGVVVVVLVAVVAAAAVAASAVWWWREGGRGG